MNFQRYKTTLTFQQFKAPLTIERTFENFTSEPGYREMIQNAFVFVHKNLQTL